MDLLRLILLVLVGLLTPAMATVSSEMTDVIVRDMDQDLNEAAHRDAAHSDTAPSDITLNDIGRRSGLGARIGVGCRTPTGGLIHGEFGSVARDADSAVPPPPDDDNDGLVMESFDGPSRKK